MKNLFPSSLLVCASILLPPGQVLLLAQTAPIPAPAPQTQPEVAVLLKQGQAAQNAGKVDESLRLFEQALVITRALGDKLNEAVTLNKIGKVYRNLAQQQKAMEAYSQALSLNREVGDKAGEAATLSNIGAVYAMAGQMQKALEFFNQALPVLKEVGDKDKEAATLNNISVVYNRLGQHIKALEFLNQCLSLSREIGDKGSEALALSNIGTNYTQIGQRQKALTFYNQSLPLSREIGDKSSEAETLNDIGTFYRDLGDLQKALVFYNQSLSLSQEMGDKGGEARRLKDIGTVYQLIGQPQKALKFYKQALPVLREVGDKRGEAASFSNIGSVYSQIGQPQKALEFLNQALLLRKEVGDQEGETVTMNNIGQAYQEAGQMQKALEFFNQALLLMRERGNKAHEASILNSIGLTYADNGQPQKASEFYNQSLPLSQEVGDKMLEANALSNLGNVEESQGHLLQANQQLRAALTINEAMRESLGGSEDKVSFLGSHLSVYHIYINLLLKQNNPVAAFEWAQKTKARALLDLMESGKVDITRGTTAAEQARESELKRRVGLVNRQLVNVATGSASKAEKKARIQALKEQGAQARSELAAFTDSLYAKYPALARKRVARTASLQEVARFLPPNTALLEYVTLQGRSRDRLDKTVLFCVISQGSKASVKAYPITQTRAQLLKQAGDFRALCSDPKKDPRSQARALYNLLVAPAAPQLAGKKRLIVCPDGPLWGLPFQALMTPAVQGQPNGSRFLIEQHEVDYSYSATGAQAALLAGQSLVNKSLESNKSGNKILTGTLLALANPDFGGPASAEPENASGSTSKPRPLTVGSRPLTAGSRPLTIGSRAITVGSRALTIESAAGTSLVTRDGSGIAPLPGTQFEADAIRADFPAALIRTGALAQESLAKTQAPNYRFLHFATHGFLNDASPLDSAIVLAQPPASGDGSTEDGLLTAREIFDLNWPAELVVLSACNTARGGQSAGEGVVGLSWALFVAGAPSQVLSQWAVADASTAQLMKSFYTNIKAKQSKGAALRGASLSLMRDGQHKHPYYWAPFVLIGDWK